MAGADGHSVAAGGRDVRQRRRRRRSEQLVMAPRYSRHGMRRHHNGVHVLRQWRKHVVLKLTGHVADRLVISHHDYLAAPAVRLADPEVTATRPYQLSEVA